MTSTPPIVVGPVGRERHILIEGRKHSDESGHAVARKILDDRTRLGGSGFFALWALKHRGAESRILTNTGDSDWVRDELARVGAGLLVADERSGVASEYVSIWRHNSSEKQLYVRSATDPSDSLVDRFLDCPATTVIGLSLLEPESYIHLTEVVAARGHRLFVATNQTLLGERDVFAQVMKVATGAYLSENEALAAANSQTMLGVDEWYQSLRPRGTLLVTHAGSGLSVLRPTGITSMAGPIAQNLAGYALGGGDMFAAVASVTWGLQVSEQRLAAASMATSRLIEGLSPFR